MKEITVRGIIIGIILAIILAASNTYLALKIGFLTSASIPAAVIAMGILRFFRHSTILENNMIQTAASAGEAIAGGIVYTIPALVIIGYWTHFGYLDNFMIALIGGVLGVLFSVPLRRVLLNESRLTFPEGQAISKVLQIGQAQPEQVAYLLKGGLLGALIEFLQSGLQIVASSAQGFVKIGNTLIGFSSGFSATLIGAGYLIGFNTGLSLLIGGMIGSLILLPYFSGFLHLPLVGHNPTLMAQHLWNHDGRFVGIGSMLMAGVWTLLTLLKPVGAGIVASWQSLSLPRQSQVDVDMPFRYVALGISGALLLAYFLFKNILPILPLPHLMIAALLFIVIVGFIFSAICGYFSGMVGVSASPGSAVVIGGLLIVAFSLRVILLHHAVILTPAVLEKASAVVIILIAIVTGSACITNDNIQDLKVGQIVGSTPWKQQVMLLIGVVAAAAVVPLLMQLLFSVYGLGGVFPHPNMSVEKMLPAPVPSVLAAATQAVLHHQLPINMLALGAGIILIFIISNYFLRQTKWQFSILGIAMGLYLPLSSSTPLFIGSLFALMLRNRAHKSVLMACGLVAGAALMDVLLAVPFAISGNPNFLAIMPSNYQPLAILLGILSVVSLGILFYRTKLV